MKQDNPPEGNPASRRDALTWTIFAAFGILFLWVAAPVILVVFAAVLFALFLRGMSDWVRERTPLSKNWSLVAVILLLAAVFGTALWLLAPSISDQFDQLAQSLPRSTAGFTQKLQKYEWGKWLLSQGPSALVSGGGNVLTSVSGVFSSTFGILLNFGLTFIIGFYLAAEIERYRDGLVRLFPAAKQDRARQVLHHAGDTLRGWLMGQMVSMTALGVFAFAGLLLLKIPLALTLAIFTALMTFIPTLGPILSMIPPVLLGLAQSPAKALSVALFYVILQNAEGNFITPMVQRRVISLPPALLIPAQLLLAILFGFWGLILAAPLTALGMALVKTVYLEDILGEKPSAD